MRQAVTFTPWRSIRDGAIGVPERDVSFHEALESPCSTCRSAPCCTHLPIHSFRVATAADLSHAAYLLNFDRIRLGVKRSGEWSVYYVEPCRFLDRARFQCTVHGRPEQPQICVQYNPYTCWYKPALTGMVADEFLLIDRSRLEYLTRETRFDELRNVVDMPHWDALVEAFRDLSDDPIDSPEPPIADLAFDAWRDDVLGAAPSSVETVPAAVHDPAGADGFGYDQLRDPCTGCSAPCCETLTFPQGRPLTISTLDFFRFALGFSGIELFLTDDGWWLVVKTRCRHLQDGRCAIYGKPERPLLCKYYDAWKCTYRVEFGRPRPPGALRLRLEHYAALTETMRFDAEGTITELPPVEVIRDHVEQRWREGRPDRTTVTLDAASTNGPVQVVGAGG